MLYCAAESVPAALPTLTTTAVLRLVSQTQCWCDIVFSCPEWQTDQAFLTFGAPVPSAVLEKDRHATTLNMYSRVHWPWAASPFAQMFCSLMCCSAGPLCHFKAGLIDSNNKACVEATTPHHLS